MNETQDSVPTLEPEPAPLSRRAALLVFGVALLLNSIGVHARAPVAWAELLTLIAARETVQTGDWLLPTVNGEPRIAKPPLPVWTTALTGPEGARWVSVLVAALGALGVAWYAGFWAGIFAGSVPLVFQHAHLASSDIWVFGSIAWAAALAERKRWWGCGLVLALGGLAKAPAVQLFFLLGYFRDRRAWGAALASLIPTLVWAGLVMARTPGAMDIWYQEIFVYRLSDPDQEAGLANYLQVFPFLFPWIAWIVCGLIPVAPDGRWKRTATWCGLATLVLVAIRTPQARYFLALVPAFCRIAALFWEGVAAGVRTRFLFYGGLHAIALIALWVSVVAVAAVQGVPGPGWVWWILPAAGAAGFFGVLRTFQGRMRAAALWSLLILAGCLPLAYEALDRRAQRRDLPRAGEMARALRTLPAGPVFVSWKKIPHPRLLWLLDRRVALMEEDFAETGRPFLLRDKEEDRWIPRFVEAQRKQGRRVVFLGPSLTDVQGTYYLAKLERAGD